MTLVEQLLKDGTAKGMCQWGQDRLVPGISTQELADLFVRASDFCIANDFPTLDWLRQNIGAQAEPYGFYVDRLSGGKVICNPNPRGVVLNGGCKMMFQYTGTASRMYVRHRSVAKVNVAGNAIVTIDVYDSAHLHVSALGSNAKVYVYQYGDATVTTRGKGIQVVRKQ